MRTDLPENPEPQIFETGYYERLHTIEERHWWAMGMRDGMDALLRTILRNRKQLKVLDVGCGTGYLLHYLNVYDLRGEVVGLDYSSYALRFCQKRGARQLLQGSAVDPPFPSASFDLIVCNDTLQHLWPDGADQKALNAFARVLRPDGILYLRTNSALGRRPLRSVDANLYRRYRRRQLESMVHKSGLDVHRATYLNFLPSIWAALKEFSMTAKKSGAAGPGLAIDLPRSRLINQIMYTVLRTEAWVIGELGIDLPFGHSLAVVASKPNK